MDQDAGAAPTGRWEAGRSEDLKKSQAGGTQLSVTQMEVVTVVVMVAKAK